MGLRFRKSVNLGGGFRVNFGKSGVGYSFGTKGARVTKTAKGTVRRTISIPGTGVSYVDEHKINKGVNTGRDSIEIPVNECNEYEEEYVENNIENNVEYVPEYKAYQTWGAILIFAGLLLSCVSIGKFIALIGVVLTIVAIVNGCDRKALSIVMVIIGLLPVMIGISSLGEDNDTFTIEEGEKGNYGELLTFNAGTEFEETKYYYFVPVGTYDVTNVGTSAANVASYGRDRHITEKGWEEPATFYGDCVIEPNGTLTLLLRDGYIEISEGAKLKFKPVDLDY